jgi:hypothetical protein
VPEFIPESKRWIGKSSRLDAASYLAAVVAVGLVVGGPTKPIAWFASRFHLRNPASANDVTRSLAALSARARSTSFLSASTGVRVRDYPVALEKLLERMPDIG